jgi:hypothetical protein
MTEITNSSRPTMDGPANYKIIVLGQLDPIWARRLEGMNATSVVLADGKIETTLQGRNDSISIPHSTIHNDDS